MRALLASLLLTACTAAAPTRAPEQPASAPEQPAPASASRASAPRVASCPADASPVAVDFEPRIEVGHAGGVTWIAGDIGREFGLAHLGPAGALVLTRVPLRDASVAAVEGSRIWLYASRRGAPELPSRWTAVDVGDPEAPVAGPVVPLKLSVRTDDAKALAVGSRRALLVTGSELVVFDPASGAVVGAASAVGEGFEPTAASCDVDRCAVVGIDDARSGPDRRLVVLRAGPDGVVEREQLSPGWASEPQAALAGSRVIVAWIGHDGPWLRALDRRGRAVGPIVAPPPGREYTRAALFVTDDAPLLGLADRDLWFVAPVGPDASLGPLRELPGTKDRWLFGAPLADGLAWAGIHEDTYYSEGLHAWSSQVIAGFLPQIGAAPGPPATIASFSGDGRGGLRVHVLARPGAAAALISPHGDPSDDPDGRPRTIPLRTPCASSPTPAGAAP